MENIEKHLIHENETIVQAMKRIDSLPLTLTLFVLNSNDQIVGTLTDGDIRRGLIEGRSLEQPVSSFMYTEFLTLHDTCPLEDFKEAQKRGIKLLPVVDGNKKLVNIYDLQKQKSILPLHCVLMAGGRGERLRPLTDDIPKPLLPLGDKPIIEHAIDKAVQYGINRFHISVRYRKEQIVDFLGDGSQKEVNIKYIHEEQPMGTAGSLSLLSEIDTEYVLLMNSDVFTDADLEELYLQTKSNNASIGVATVPYTTKIPYGIFDICDRKITGLIEKPKYTYYANAGIYVLHRDVLSEVPENSFYNTTDLIDSLIAKGRKVIHNPIVGFWVDIGQYQDYLNAQNILAQRREA